MSLPESRADDDLEYVWENQVRYEETDAQTVDRCSRHRQMPIAFDWMRILIAGGWQDTTQYPLLEYSILKPIE